MPYNPELPADHSEMLAGEMRDQLNGLKELVEERPDRAEVHSTIIDETAGNCTSVEVMEMTVLNPPTQGQMQAVVNKLNELIMVLKRMS